MDAQQHHRSPRSVLSAALGAADLDDNAFIAACLDVTNQSDAAGTQITVERRDESIPVTRPEPAPFADSQEIVRRLEAKVEGLGEALAQAQAQVKASAETLRQHEELRQSIAVSRENSPPDAGSHTRQDQTLGELGSEMMLNHSSDVSALREASRRETQLRTELQALRSEFASLKVKHDDAMAALHESSQRTSDARSELSRALAHNDAAVERLHQIIAQRDREITDLQHRLLESEEARSADAAAILDSLGNYRQP